MDGYNIIIEHTTKDKHQSADSIRKKTDFYERQKQREADRPEIKDGFSFMDRETYDSLPDENTLNAKSRNSFSN